MIEILGIIYMAMWAGGKAKQKGKNKYLWTLIPVGLYLIIYIIAFAIISVGFKSNLESIESGYSSMLMILIKVALVPVAFLLTKLIMDKLFERMDDRKYSEGQ